MKLTKEQIIRLGFLLLCSAVLIVCSAVLLNQKEAMYLDEYYSYGCANSMNAKYMTFKTGLTYTAEELEQMERNTYMSGEGNRFRFGKVWLHMSMNVHPPVFYAMLHLACSLTPGVFSVWQAGAVNILFGLVGFFFFWKLVRSLVRSEWLAGILCLCWACTQGLYADIVLLRDYAAGTCALLIVTWEIFRYLRGNRRIPDLVKIGLASAFCALTHYYCVIYLFFLCAVLCVILMARREWKAFFSLVAAEAAAAGLAIAAFPSMVRQILSSGRGVEAAENLADLNVDGYLKSVAYFYREMNKALFGNLLPWLALLILAVVAAALLLRKRKGPEPAEGSRPEITGTEYCLLAIPAICFYFMVCKISPFLTDRYMYPAMPILYLLVPCLLYLAGKRLPKPRLMAAGLAGVMAVTCCLSWTTGAFPKLYRGNREKLSVLEAYRGIEAVEVWDSYKGLSGVAIPQREYYSAVTFCYKPKEGMLESIPVLTEGRNAMVLVGGHQPDETLARLQELYPDYTVTELGNLDGQNRFTNYYFHKE